MSRREYMLEYRKRTEEIRNEEIRCEICNGKYKKKNKWNHENTVKHKYAELKVKYEAKVCI